MFHLIMYGIYNFLLKKAWIKPEINPYTKENGKKEFVKFIQFSIFVILVLFLFFVKAILALIVLAIAMPFLWNVIANLRRKKENFIEKEIIQNIKEEKKSEEKSTLRKKYIYSNKIVFTKKEIFWNKRKKIKRINDGTQIFEIISIFIDNNYLILSYGFSGITFFQYCFYIEDKKKKEVKNIIDEKNGKKTVPLKK